MLLVVLGHHVWIAAGRVEPLFALLALDMRDFRPVRPAVAVELSNTHRIVTVRAAHKRSEMMPDKMCQTRTCCEFRECFLVKKFSRVH